MAARLCLGVALLLMHVNKVVMGIGILDFKKMDNGTCLKINTSVKIPTTFSNYSVSCYPLSAKAKFRQNSTIVESGQTYPVNISETICDGFTDGDQPYCVVQNSSSHQPFLSPVIPCYYKLETIMLRPVSGYVPYTEDGDKHCYNIYWFIPLNDADLDKIQVCCYNDEALLECKDGPTLNKDFGNVSFCGPVHNCIVKATHAARDGKEYTTCDFIATRPGNLQIHRTIVSTGSGEICIGLQWQNESVGGSAPEVESSQIMCSMDAQFAFNYTIRKADNPGNGTDTTTLCIQNNHSDNFLFCKLYNKYKGNGTEYISGILDSSINPPPSRVSYVKLIPNAAGACIRIDWTVPRTFFSLEEHRLCCGSPENCSSVSFQHNPLSGHKSINLSATNCLDIVAKATVDCKLINIFDPNVTVSQNISVVVTPASYHPPREILLSDFNGTCATFQWENLQTTDFIKSSKINCHSRTGSFWNEREYKAKQSSKTGNMTQEVCSNSTVERESLSCVIEVFYTDGYYMDIGVSKGLYCSGTLRNVSAEDNNNSSLVDLVVDYVRVEGDKAVYNISWIWVNPDAAICFGWACSNNFAVNITAKNSNLIFMNQSALQYEFDVEQQYIIELYTCNNGHLLLLAKFNGTTSQQRNITIRATSSTCMNISWLPPAVSNDIMQYKVQCSGRPSYVNSSGLSMSMCGFKSGQSVMCNVSAFNEAGKSDLGSSNIETMPCDSPEAIQNISSGRHIEKDLRGRLQHISWNLSWQLGEHNCQEVSYYNITVEEWNETYSVNTPEFTLTVTEVNKMYTVIIVAVNNWHMKGDAIRESFTFNEEAPTSSPILSMKSINSSCIDVSLGYLDTEKAPIRSYVLECKLSGEDRILFNDYINAGTSSTVSVTICETAQSYTMLCSAQLSNFAGQSGKVSSDITVNYRTSLRDLPSRFLHQTTPVIGITDDQDLPDDDSQTSEPVITETPTTINPTSAPLTCAGSESCTKMNYVYITICILYAAVMQA